MAKKQDARTIVCINRNKKVALLSDHKTEVPFEVMHDRDGEETLDIQEAVSATLEMPSGLWISLDLRDWVTVTLH